MFYSEEACNVIKNTAFSNDRILLCAVKVIIYVPFSLFFSANAVLCEFMEVINERLLPDHRAFICGFLPF